MKKERFMPSEHNKVTVCITTYNRLDRVKEAVKSVFNQTYTNFELIVVDDCSSDGTEAYFNEVFVNNDKLIYIRHEDNKGLAAARNTAILSGTGKYFTFCDDDDLWDINYLSEFVKVADEYDDNWCFSCGAKKDNGEIYLNQFFDGKLSYYISRGFTPPVAGQFYNLNRLKEIGGYNENIKSGVDHDLWIKLSTHGSHIKSIGLALAIPNLYYNDGRITCNEDSRRTGINKSLKTWEIMITDFYGADFYKAFFKSYQIHLDKQFIFKYLGNKSFFKAFKLYLRSKYKYIILKTFICNRFFLKGSDKPLLYIKSGGINEKNL